jgi:hypothetical protein
MMDGNAQSTTALSPTTLTTLAAVLYHALVGGAIYDQAIADAQHAGNLALAAFLQQVQQEDRQRALQAQQLLAQSGNDGKGIPDLQN